MKTITKAEIKERIAKSYTKINWQEQIDFRNLVETPSVCNHGKVGCILFALDGSPPKGYALYVPGHFMLIYVDAWGKLVYKQESVVVEGYND